ncbi:MAG TPA: MFS transporter [Phycisphaerae bacterium]|nr:MFS transporter [Phycisphaerae bacterium]
MARRNFAIEIRHLFLWGLFAGLVEGTVSAVVVSKTFGGTDLLITIVQATPAFANLSSLLWGAMLVGRRKLPVFMALAAAAVAVAFSVAFTPNSGFGGWIFALQICLSRVFMSGVVTAQAGLWRANYPKTHRGRITASLQIVRTIMSLPVILGCGLLFDRDESAYRWFYPAIACIGAVGLLVFRLIHVRGEAKALAARAAGGTDSTADADLIAPFTLSALVSPWQVFGRMREALRQDPRFARYCTAQMCIGTANLMIMPVNTIILTKVLNLTYTASNGLLDIIPRIAMILTLPLWARLFDRVGVLRFRVVNSGCWCGSLLFCGLGAYLAAAHERSPAAGLLGAAITAYIVGRVVDGLAQSGGAIAWYIGHLHFAEDEKAELYMGIHVSLTGLRGLLAPFVGTLLYAFSGWSAFAVAFVISAVGMGIFAKLAREERRS